MWYKKYFFFIYSGRITEGVQMHFSSIRVLGIFCSGFTLFWRTVYGIPSSAGDGNFPKNRSAFAVFDYKLTFLVAVFDQKFEGVMVLETPVDQIDKYITYNVCFYSYKKTFNTHNFSLYFNLYKEKGYWQWIRSGGVTFWIK